MRKLIIVALMALAISGCGTIERTYDQENYESLSNEEGTLHLVGPGMTDYKVVPNAKIIYSNADSMAVFYKVAGKKFYWQGFVWMEID